MSRSYRKNPVNKYNDTSMKKAANRKIRRTFKENPEEIQDGNSYKKEFSSYNISDYTYKYYDYDDDYEYKIKSLRK